MKAWVHDGEVSQKYKSSLGDSSSMGNSKLTDYPEPHLLRNAVKCPHETPKPKFGEISRPGARADLGRPTTSTHQNKEHRIKELRKSKRQRLS